MVRPLALWGALALAVTASMAFAQQPAPAPAPAPGGAPGGQQARVPPARGPETALALEAAQTALSTCTTNGYKVAASIVDSGGVLKVLLAVDGASKGAVESSTKKAVTANTLKAATSDVQEKMKTDQALATKINADTNLFVRAGGLTLVVGGDVIGAIGVGGAPGGEKDEACAKAGIDKIQARLK
jgi:uncharacterized protein GlcG (DUF336 family)